MLEHARGWLGEPAALVSFNGKTFDLPLIATRHRLCALSDPFAGRAHVDLLYPVRRLFAGRWPDCRLSTVEKRLLGLVRQDDLSGAEAPQAWFDWLRQGVPGRLPGVIEHNRLDLISLAALIPYVRACYDDPVAWDADPLALVKSALHESAERDAYRYLSANRYRLEDEASLALARLARRAGDYALAVDIWRELAGIDHPEALGASRQVPRARRAQSAASPRGYPSPARPRARRSAPPSPLQSNPAQTRRRGWPRRPRRPLTTRRLPLTLARTIHETDVCSLAL